MAELLRSSLLEANHLAYQGCPKYARGEGHQVFVLTVTYTGGCMQQFSVRRERFAPPPGTADQMLSENRTSR
jgi:hypothetical protein